MIKNCKAPGPLYVSALSEGELRHLNNMMGRLYQLAEAATAVRARPLSLACSSTEAHHGLPTLDDIDLLIVIAGSAIAWQDFHGCARLDTTAACLMLVLLQALNSAEG